MMNLSEWNYWQRQSDECISLLQIFEPPTLREASYIPNPSPRGRREPEFKVPLPRERDLG